MTLRILQCSDFHLAARPADDARRMDAVRRHVERIKPDRIVFTGDLVENGPADPASLKRGRDLLDSLGVPWHAVPGNHDVGNKASIGRYVVTDESMAHWHNVFGDASFTHDAPGWRIIGLNTQVTGSSLAAEAAQLQWLADVVACDRKVAVFMHMPLYLYDRNEALTSREGYWQVDADAREKLLPLLEQQNVKFIATGHVHWHAVFPSEPRRIWCPSSYCVVREPHYPPGGDCCGMILHTLSDDATHELIADPALSRPEGEHKD